MLDRPKTGVSRLRAVGTAFASFIGDANSAQAAAPGALAMRSKVTMVPSEPYPFELRPAECGLLIIDMQRDFLEPGGFGEMLGNDVSQLRRTIEPSKRLLAAWRGGGPPGMLARAGP